MTSRRPPIAAFLARMGGRGLKRPLAASAIAALTLVAAGCGSGNGRPGTAASSATTASSSTTAGRPARHAAQSPAKAARSAPRPPLTRHGIRAPETLAPAQRSRLARSGALSVPVTVGGPGRVSAFGQAGIGHATVKVAHAEPVQAQDRGVVHITLRLNHFARRHLAAGHSFLMYVGVSFSKGFEGQRITVPLSPSRARRQ